jgi:hypothetical protein
METENITISEQEPVPTELPVVEQTTPPSSVEEESPSPEIDLTKIPITNENVALNVLVTYLNIAQRRGVFSFEESGKIWECIRIFITPIEPVTSPAAEQ